MTTKTTFIATGDSFMTRHLPEGGYEGFREIRELIESHDVRFNNLEFTAHNMEGWPSAFSGGTWAIAAPEVLDDLKAFGFNIYNTANNHAMDFSAGGLLATIAHLRERGMNSMGTGRNLDEASAPAFLECKNARVALIGLVSTFHDSDIAGPQGPGVPGRPGLNPLRFDTVYGVDGQTLEKLRSIADETHMNALMNFAVRNNFMAPLPENVFCFGDLIFCAAEKPFKKTVPKKADLERTVRTIKDARLQADHVVVSLHVHDFSGEDNKEPAEYTRIFAHSCIEAGATAVICHGPHELHWIEIYRGKPVFYSLGNFIFESDTVACQPAEAFTKAGLPADAGVGTYMSHRNSNETKGYCVQKNIWRSVMASFTAEDDRVTEIQLYPIDLHMELPRCRRGLPTLSRSEETLAYLAEISKGFGTKLEIRDGVGTIRL